MPILCNPSSFKIAHATHIKALRKCGRFVTALESDIFILVFVKPDPCMRALIGMPTILLFMRYYRRL